MSPWRRYSPGLRDGADRRERERRHLGVGLRLAAEREQRDAALGAARAQQIEALGPAAPAAEHAAEHDARVRQHVVDERRVVDRRARIRAAHLGEAVRKPLHRSGRREDLGIGGGYEAQHGSASASQVTRVHPHASSGSSVPAFERSRRSSSWLTAARLPITVARPPRIHTGFPAPPR